MTITVRRETVSHPSRATPGRRGVALLMVLALLAVTLALSYSMLRTQTTNEQIQSNYHRRAEARQAAMAGMSAGLRKISQHDWAGVGVNLAGNLGGNMSYVLSYETGDVGLAAGDPDYDLYPYRVTLTSLGTAVDPANASLRSEHRMRAVLQLVPRQLADPPANWSSLQGYTLYQWSSDGSDEAKFQIPARIAGRIRLSNRLRFSEAYPGDADNRPFAGSMDEVALFGAALSGQQMLDLANDVTGIGDLVSNPLLNPLAWWRLEESLGAAVAIDELGSYHGTYDGATAGAAPAPDGGGTSAAHFDGVNDQIHLGAIDVNGLGFTILARFQVDHFNTPDARIISKTNGTGEDDHYWMLSTVESGGDYRLRFRVKTGAAGTETLTASSGDLVAGTWVLAGAVFDGMEMRLYKDGVEVGSRSHFGLVSTDPTVQAAIGDNPPGSPQARYLRDLTAELSAGGTDHRPLTGPIEAPRSMTDAAVWSLLEDELELQVLDTAAPGGVPLTHPGDVVSYQLYPGGASYQVQLLPSTLANTALEPDPLTNPLGVFKRQQEVILDDNVSVTGTVIIVDTGGQGDIELHGNNVSMSPVDLPAIYGESTTRQLPVAIAGDDFRIVNGTSTMTGMVVAWDEFDMPFGSETTEFTGQGAVLAEELDIRGRGEWNQASSWWKDRAIEFFGQLAGPGSGERFPQWLETNWSLARSPKLRLEPDPAAPSYHWHDWSQPLFVAHPNDGGGLRWDLIQWFDEG